eukprot:3985944-Amphidinium_carterae.1
MTCMILLSTTLLRSHFATNTVGTADYGEAMDLERDQPMVHERPPPRSSYRRTIRDEDEIDAWTAYSDHQGAQGPRAGLRINQQYDLLKNTLDSLEYITHLPGDTAEDARRMEQILVLEDDIQSLDDEEYYRREPGDTQDLVEMEATHRQDEAQARRQRRDEEGQ